MDTKGTKDTKGKDTKDKTRLKLQITLLTTEDTEDALSVVTSLSLHFPDAQADLAAPSA